MWVVLIYVLLEHQSKADPQMALRLLLYMAGAEFHKM